MEVLKKLQLRRNGPLNVVYVQPRTVTIDEDVVENNISVNRESITRWMEEIDTATPAVSEKSYTPPPALLLQQEVCDAQTKNKSTDKSQKTADLVADKTIGHADTAHGRDYIRQCI